ncbi:MAG: DNA mismatch repair endonuclease MutL [Eubacteriales bacterium]|nr:DNA mismatch repair endonuclease MutL [Eubacteriales bacterium]
MSVINILSPHVADLIAAGEVVERPASVIKELIENSFDAGAQNIICEIRNGGMTYIRVTDDGCGMSPEDAGIAFLRHATSKLQSEAGLESIGTMGFRGEALAAISSVSRIELLTRQAGSSEGIRVLLDAGDIQDMTAFGCPDGTTMIIRDLFYNTPARQKFMKSDRSEASACITAALRCALARPDVSVRMIRDGEDEFFSPGDGRIDSCLYSLLGREEAASMLQCSSSSENMRLSGYLSSPSECRGNRAHQFFFVNGRFIKSQLLQTALEQAYKNTLLTGRYPSCAIYLEIPFGAVDVNVHPAKTEVRFGSEKTVFDFVYHAVKFALESEDRLSSSNSGFVSSFSENASFRSSQRSDPAKKRPVPVETIQAIERKTEPAKTEVPETFESSGKDNSDTHMSAYSLPYSQETPQPFSQDEFLPSPEETLIRQNPQTAEKSSLSAVSSAAVEKNVENSVQNVERLQIPNHKILGEAFRTYIIVEQNGEILLIDKHAAHERIIFNRLKNNREEISSQLLIVPETVHLSYEDSELIEKNGELLADLGFEIEPYGNSDYIVRGVPADMDPGDISSAVQEICDQLHSGISLDPSDMRDSILHTVACKAAIKAGWDTSLPELEKIVSSVLSGEIKYCPHGRPVSIIVTRADLDKLFKRIV